MDGAAIRFRLLEEDDLPAVVGWLAAPHVRRWWRDPIDLPAVRAKYLPRIRGQEATEVFVIEHGGRGVGLIQRYRFVDHGTWATTVAGSGLAFPAGAGIDYLIGDADCIGRGVGSAAIELFTLRLFRDYGDVTTVVVVPQAENIPSRRVLEKSGYEHVWTGLLDSDDPADGGSAAIYVRRRPN